MRRVAFLRGSSYRGVASGCSVGRFRGVNNNNVIGRDFSVVGSYVGSKSQKQYSGCNLGYSMGLNIGSRSFCIDAIDYRGKNGGKMEGRIGARRRFGTERVEEVRKAAHR
mmetsp:Transcript_21995/g.45824  ORF Transcript_21995/g.45824 Transcript_21995/m.45824 type:complete len:110 (-) Transcript_21995:99-428(-)